MYKSIFLIVVSFSCFFSYASEVLTIDRVGASQLQYAFDNDGSIQPLTSDFKVEHFVLMSNEEGERWGVLTMTNQSSGRRELEAKHLLALFADGSRHNPTEFKRTFKGNETQSITLNFGESKFPILSIYTRN